MFDQRRHKLCMIVMWVIRIAAVCVLSLSVLSKINSVNVLISGGSLLSHPIILFATIAIESFVVVFLLTSRPTWAWRVAFSLFAVFTLFACYAWLSKTDCGCFGSPELSWMSLPIDIAFVSILLLTASLWHDDANTSVNASAVRESNFRGTLGKSRQVVAICLGLCASAMGLGFSIISSNQRLEGDIIPSLLASEMEGNAWPNLETRESQLEILRNGQWLVLFVHEDCDRCRELVESLKGVQIDKLPFGVVTFVAGRKSWPIHIGALSVNADSKIGIEWHDQPEPFVASPAAFRIDEGKIVTAREGKDASRFVSNVMCSGDWDKF